jgi:hypothetical protein
VRFRSQRRHGAAGAADPLQEQQRGFVGPALIDGARQQLARLLEIAGVIRRKTTMQQLFRLPLFLRQRIACAFDVGTGAPVPRSRNATRVQMLIACS